MLSYVSNLELYLLAVTIALKSVLALFLLLRNIWRTYPFFTILSILLAVKSWYLLYLLSHASARDYFLIFWNWEAAASALTLSVIVELVEKICRPGRMVPYSVMRWLFYGLLSAIIAAYSVTERNVFPSHPLLSIDIALDRSCSYSACGMLGVLLLFTKSFTIKWRPQAAAIAGGLAVTCLLVIVAPAKQFFPGPVRDCFVPLSLAITSLISGTWIVLLSRVAAPSEAAGESFAELNLLLAGLQGPPENGRNREWSTVN